MFANAVLYNLEGKYEQPIQVGPLTMSWREVLTRIESALVVTPMNIVIVFLFQKGAEKSATIVSKVAWSLVSLGICLFFLVLCRLRFQFFLQSHLEKRVSVSSGCLLSYLIRVGRNNQETSKGALHSLNSRDHFKDKGEETKSICLVKPSAG